MVAVGELETVVYGSGRCQALGMCACVDEGRSEYLVDDYYGLDVVVVRALVRSITQAQARDRAEGVRKHLQRLVLPWPKRTRRIVKAYLTGVHEEATAVQAPVRTKKRQRDDEEDDNVSLSQLQEMSAAFNVQVCTTKPACRRRINEALRQQYETGKALEETMRLEVREKEEERLRMEKEVRETLEKELRARLKEEAEQKEKEDAREAELSGSLAGIRQKPCRHGYQCLLFWVSWSHCSKFHHQSNMGVWDANGP